MAAPTSVDAYLAAVPEGQRAALERLRTIIHAAAPEATETISYQIPTFKDHGRALVAFAAFKEHCSLFPMSLAIVAGLAEELKPWYTQKGTIRFRPDQPLPDALVTKIVKARLAENAARAHR